MLSILTYPDPRLNLKAELVTSFDAELKQQAHAMLNLMYESGGVGLASIQVDVQKSMFVMDISPTYDTPMILINPKIAHQEGSQTNQEGCLSFPSIRIKVTRPQTIEVEYQDLDGNTLKQKGSDLFAQCVHHECEHLNGDVFIKDLSRLKQNLISKKLNKLKSTATP